MANLLVFISVFIFGLLVGSFLNCVIYRTELKDNIVKSPGKKSFSFLRGKSFCPKCGRALAWYDLIPVFSYIFLKGRCRYCGKKISIQYPLVELITGALFLLIFWLFDFRPDLTFGFWILISCFLIVIFVFDLKHFLIPDKIIYPAILIVLVFGISNYFFAALGAALFFLAIFLLSKGRWLGFGDIKLIFLLGLLLGFPDILICLFFASLIGALTGTGLILFKKKRFKSEVPFAPFLITGAYISLFFSKKIISWYLGIWIF